MQALSKDPRHRYGSVDQLSEDINRHLQGLPLAAPAYFVKSELDTAAVPTAPLAVSEPATASQIVIPKRVARKALVVSAAVIALILAIEGFYNHIRRAQKPEQATQLSHSPRLSNSIAVLPFKPKIANEAEKLLGVGLADVITNKLGQVKQLSVRPASASRRYLDSDLDPPRVGAELGVEYVVSGALERNGERLGIDLQIFSLKERKVVWTAKIDEKLTDIAALQNSISEGILRSLTIEPNGAGQKFFVKRDTDSSEAYQLYLVGRYHWGKRSIAGFNEAIKFFNEAIRKDPKFALAYAGLADCQALLQVYQSPPPPDGHIRARENALKALRLDDSLAEAHASLAYVSFFFDRDRRGAEASFRRAIDLNPSYATARHWLALALSALGRHDEAMVEIRQAEQLNPQSAIIITAAGMIYFNARQFDRALDECRRALELDPGLVQAHRLVRWVHQATGRYDDALAAYQKEKSFWGDTGTDWPVILAQLQAVGGKRQEALLNLKKSAAALPALRQGDFQPFQIAVAYALLGERDQALSWLAKAEAIRSASFNYALVDPLLDNLRSDPRFAALMKKAGFQD
jgi:TolB-like protein/Tfp pilus assembly protein PilF